MRSKLLAVSLLSIASLTPSFAEAQGTSALVRPAVYSSAHSRQVEVTPVVVHRRRYYRRNHAKRRTAVRVGGGAAAGAAIGALAGGGKGAGIGAIAGGGAGALYDQHERHKGR